MGISRQNALPAAPGISPRFAGKIVVMSHNAMNYFDDETSQGKLSSGAFRNNRQWPKSEKSVAAEGEIIRNIKPDVAALQEIGSKSALEKLDKFQLGGRYPTVTIFPTNDQRNLHVANMNRNSLQLVRSQTHANKRDKNGYPVFQRDFLETTYRTPGGYQFTLFNTHFKSMKEGEEETVKIRLKEAREAAEIIADKIRRNPGIKLMVVGDLNSRHDSKYGKAVLDALSGREKGDPRFILTEVLEKEALEKKRDVPLTHSRENGQKSKLDYCFVSPAMLPDIKRAYVAGQFGLYPYKQASDHLPVVVEIEEPQSANPPRFAAATKNPGQPERPRLRLLA